LFSREDVAGVIERNFEPVWEMVRQAPIIRIDFGNDNVVTRTLHGNVASHVCFADGQVLDILPGIYTPAVYAAALEQLRRVADNVRQAQDQRQTRLRQYHQQWAQLLRAPQPRISYPRTTVAPPGRSGPTAAMAIVAGAAGAALANTVANAQRNRADPGKHAVEMRVEQIVVQPPVAGAASANGRPTRPTRANLAEWEALATDTWINESQRRLQIHDEMARGNPVRPEQIKRWLYRDVLHADLDDPYLGLGDALLGDDLFREVEHA
jgi:hypothetical protein